MDERRAEHNAGEPEPDAPEHHPERYEAMAMEHSPEHSYDAAYHEAPETGDPHAPHPASTPERRSIAAWWLLPVVALILIVAGGATSPWWAPPLAPLLPWSAASGFADRDARAQIDAVAKRLAQLEQRPAALPPGALDKTNEQLAALDKRLGGLEQQLTKLGPGGAASGDLAALQQATQRESTAEAQLADRVTALESKAPAIDPAALKDLQGAVTTLTTDLAALNQRVDKLAAPAPDETRTDQALVLALGQLRQAMTGSAPFGDALSAASGLAQNRPEIKAALASLGEAAAHGVPSLAILRERFERIAGEIANANETPSSAWGPWITDRLRSIFAARRVGTGAAGSGPEAIVATAEGALQAGDLAGAVAALGTLRGAAAATAKPWLDDARRRLDADAALAKASDLVTAHLAQASPASGTTAPNPATGTPATKP